MIVADCWRLISIVPHWGLAAAGATGGNNERYTDNSWFRWRPRYRPSQNAGVTIPGCVLLGDGHAPLLSPLFPLILDVGWAGFPWRRQTTGRFPTSSSPACSARSCGRRSRIQDGVEVAGTARRRIGEIRSTADNVSVGPSPFWELWFSRSISVCPKPVAERDRIQRHAEGIAVVRMPRLPCWHTSGCRRIRRCLGRNRRRSIRHRNIFPVTATDVVTAVEVRRRVPVAASASVTVRGLELCGGNVP